MCWVIWASGPVTGSSSSVTPGVDSSAPRCIRCTSTTGGRREKGGQGEQTSERMPSVTPQTRTLGLMDQNFLPWCLETERHQSSWKSARIPGKPNYPLVILPHIDFWKSSGGLQGSENWDRYQWVLVSMVNRALTPLTWTVSHFTWVLLWSAMSVEQLENLRPSADI